MAISTELQVLTETDFSEFDDLIKQFENFGKGEEFKIEEVKPKELTPEELEEIERKRIIAEKLKTYPIKKIQHKIYIEYKCEHREVQLTSLTTPLLLIESFIHKRFIPPDKTWTLFEVNSGFKCERYVRDWEPITSILENWEPENENMLVLKRYHARLTDMINLIPSDPPVLSSSAYLEIKPGKWEKRYLFLKRQNIYISKNKSPSGATILCNLSSFDAYTLTTKRKSPPYPFCIALKSQDSILIFEKPERDYVNYLSFENKIILKNWLYAIYYSRNISIWEDRPDDECLFVPPKYHVDSDDITTLEFDQGQFSELDPSLPFKARMKAQKEATSKLRFVKQLFGASEKKLEINTKPDSEVFKKGSLLDAIQSPSSGDSSDSKSTESDSVFASGSLLSRSSSTKVKPAKTSETTNGPLVDASTPTPFLNGSLLDNATQLQESKQAPQRRNGPLIDALPPKHFLEGSLLDSNNSIKRDKHRTLPHNHMINYQTNINALINPMTNNSLQSSSLQSNVSQRQKYRSMLPTNAVPHVNLNTPDAATAPQVPMTKSPPLSRKNTIKAAKYQSMLPAHRTESLVVKPKHNLNLQISQNSSNYEEMQNSRSLGMGTNIYQNASHPVQPLAHNNANTDKYETTLSKLTRNQTNSRSPTSTGKLIHNTISSPNDNRHYHHQSILTKHKQQGTIHPISNVNNSILQPANQPSSNTKNQRIKFEVKPLLVKKQTNITNTAEPKRISSMGISSRLTKSQPTSPDIGSLPKYQGIPNDFQLRRAISTSTGNQFNRRQAPLVNLKD